MRSAAFVWDDALATYRFHPEHPLNPRRLELAVDLMGRLGLLEGDGCTVVAPRRAVDRDVLLAHAPEFVEAVRRASSSGASSASSLHFGLGTEDVPVVRGMHEAALGVVGSTLRAAEEVMTGRATVAFSMAGGLHHARRAEAAGFCVYNDLAVAIRWMQREFGARVLYIDIDAHHGDGVQWIFYEDPDVLTVSYHESGVYLFPGTGFVEEMGEGDGHGYSVNVPLDAHTEDDSFLAAFSGLVPELADAFRPDAILLQAGCDAHVLDPLTHLRCTTGLYERLVRIVAELADTHCDGRLIVTGGGGYAIYRVVPRAWSLVWAAARGIEPADALPEEWLKAMRVESGKEMPALLRDPAGAFEPAPRRAEVEDTNRRTVSAVRRRVLPLLTGWGLGF